MKKSYLIDTNVLIYSIDASNPFFSLARYVIKKGEDGSFYPCLSVQNICEAYAIITSSRVSKPLPSDKAVKFLSSLFTNSKFNILSINNKIVLSAFNIAKQKHIISQNFFDIVLSATIIEYNLSGIITNNPDDFRNFPFEVISLKDIFSFF
jgi:predicted nucleic acid-binding protein